MNDTDRSSIEALVQSMEDAWNAGDGAAFAAPMANDADFVNVRGEHFRGRDTIAGGHSAIFRTIYAGSTNRYTLENARMLTPDVALIHVRAVMDAPAGPMAGRNHALWSAVLTRTAAGWEIASFHNTIAQ